LAFVDDRVDDQSGAATIDGGPLVGELVVAVAGLARVLQQLLDPGTDLRAGVLGQAGIVVMGDLQPDQAVARRRCLACRVVRVRRWLELVPVAALVAFPQPVEHALPGPGQLGLLVLGQRVGSDDRAGLTGIGEQQRSSVYERGRVSRWGFVRETP
jgi:hypothetical protein